MHPDYVGFRIWYSDSSVSSSNDGAWDEVPSVGVQFVTFYRAATYQIFIDPDWVTENYVEQFHGTDYYWLDPEGRPGAGRADEVPGNATGFVLKTGATMPDTDYWDLVAEAQTVRVAP